MKDFFKQKQGKRFAGIAVVLLLACYLLVTGVSAQKANQEAVNVKYTYQKDPLSYGDVWSFDSGAYIASEYDLSGMTPITWYNSGGIDNTDTKESDPINNYVASVTINSLENTLGNSIDSITYMSKVEQNWLIYGTSQDTAASSVAHPDMPKIPVVTATAGDLESVYSVVPGKSGKYYIHAYVENATEDTLQLEHAILSNCEATNAFAATSGFNSDSEYSTIKLTRINGTNWYRGSVEIDNITWYAIKIKDPKRDEITGQNNSISNVNPFEGGTTDLALDSTRNYWNVWETEKIYYHTVLAIHIPANVKLGPISSEGKVIFQNSDTENGALTVQSIFGETIEIGTEQTLPNMPVVLSLEAKNGYNYKPFQDGNGNELTLSHLVEDKASTIQEIEKEKIYVYHHEGNTDTANVVSAQWAPPRSLPKIYVNGAEYNFINAKVGAATFTKGTQSDFTFTLDFSNAADFASGTYAVKGDMVNGVSEYTLEITADKNSFTVPCMFDKTEVSITIYDTYDTAHEASYTFTYTISPVTSAAKTVRNETQNKEYVFIEDALAEATSGDSLYLLNSVSFQRTENIVSAKWVESKDGYPAGYTIRNGVTLLLPYAEKNISLKGSGDNHPYALTEYTLGVNDLAGRNDNVLYTLTLQKNQTLNVKGQLIVGGAINADDGGGMAGGTSIQKKHSNIALEDGSQIIVDGSSAVLSCCGYIYNCGTNKTGQVIVQNGATAYEPFIVVDAYGGAYSLGAGGHAAGVNAGGVVPVDGGGTILKGLLSYNPPQSPQYLGNATVTGETGEAICLFQRWAVQNIQSNLVIRKGSASQGKLRAYVDIFAFDQHNTATISIIGSDGLLVQKENTIITRTYSDQAVTTINGNANYSGEPNVVKNIGKTALRIENGASFGSMQLSLKLSASVPIFGTATIRADLSSSAYDFPVPYNFEIILGGNGSYDVGGAVTLLPGSVLKVEKGSTLTLTNGGQIAIVPYLRDHRLAGGSNLTTSLSACEGETYVLEVSYPNAADLTKAGYNTNAQLIVDGTLNINSGGALGGVIQTSGSGVVNALEGASLTTINQLGAVGQANMGVEGVKTFYFHTAGASVFELPAQIYNPTTGALATIEAGNSYSAISCAQDQENFHHQIDTVGYTLYSNSCSCETTSADACQPMWYSYYKENYKSKGTVHPTIKDMQATALNIVTDGGWYQYIVNAEAAEGSDFGTASFDTLITGVGSQVQPGAYSALQTNTNTENIVGTVIGNSFTFTVSDQVKSVAWDGKILEPNEGVYSIGNIEGNITLTLTSYHCHTGIHIDENRDLKCDNKSCEQLLVKLDAIVVAADSTMELSLKFVAHDQIAAFTPTVTFGSVTLAEGTGYFTSIETVGGKTRYVYTVPVASGEMTKPVTVSFTDETGPIGVVINSDGTCGTNATTTVAAYARAVLDLAYPENATAEQIAKMDQQKELVAAMLSYGGYAQAFFVGDNYQDLAGLDSAASYLNDGERPSIAGIDATTIKDTITSNGTYLGFDSDGQVVSLDSAISQKVYFTVPNGFVADDYTFKVTFRGSTKTVTMQSDKDGYFVEIQNIPAAHLDYDYKITIVNNETKEQCEFSASVLAYLRRLIEKSANEAEVNLAKAMYVYNEAANDFFGV